MERAGHKAPIHASLQCRASQYTQPYPPLQLGPLLIAVAYKATKCSLEFQRAHFACKIAAENLMSLEEYGSKAASITTGL